MTDRSPRSRRPLVLLLGLLLVATLSTPALAAEGSADAAVDEPPPIALRLSPAVLEVPHAAGPARHELRVDNLGSEPLEVVTELSEFTVTEDGTTQFLGPEEVSATSWADLDVDRFELAPGGRRDVVLTVEVPDDAEPGERYLSAIFAVPGDPDTGSNISVTHRVAVKLYIDVPGPRTEHVELGELSGPRLIDTGRARFELPVHNRGNVHRRFEEGTQLLATAGDRDFAFENFTVLGDSTRVVEAIWPDPPLLCWCTVEVPIEDGRGQLVIASTRVIAFPLRLGLALLAFTTGVSLVAAGRRRRRASTLDRQLEAARGEDADPSSAVEEGRRPRTPTGPPARQGEHAVSPPRPAVATSAAPLAHGADTATFESDTRTPAGSDTRSGGAMIFTAHGPQHRRRGRRR